MSKALLEQARDALRLGHDAMEETAARYHIELRGHYQDRHDEMDADVAKIAAALAAIEAELAAPEPEPVAKYKLTRSIIHGCPALVLPQSFLQKLGATAQIVPLRGLSTEQAAMLLSDLNKTVPPRTGPEPVASDAMTEIDIADDEALRFVQRVLEGSNPTEQDKYAAREMILAIRTRVRSVYRRVEPVAVLTDGEIAEIAERMEAVDPTAAFWKDFARAILAAAVPPGHVVVPASVKTLMEDFDNPCFGSKIHNDIPREIGLAVLAARLKP